MDVIRLEGGDTKRGDARNIPGVASTRDGNPGGEKITLVLAVVNVGLNGQAGELGLGVGGSGNTGL